jgi:hypothetical protein
VDLENIRIRLANLPYARFEGIKLHSVSFSDTLLEAADFRNCTIQNSSFLRCNLRGAIFDRSVMSSESTDLVDFGYSDLGSSSFSGVNLGHVALFGSIFSKPTNIRPFLVHVPYEMITGEWDEAAAVFAAIGRRATEDWDFPSVETAAFLAMTCRHRRAIGAGPFGLSRWAMKGVYDNWLVPSVRAGLIGIGWMVNRLIWGYGLRWQYTAMAIAVFIIIYTFFVYCFTGLACVSGCSGSRALDLMIFSLNTFVGFTYSPAIPGDWWGYLVAGTAVVMGHILRGLLLVSITAKYLRRFGG